MYRTLSASELLAVAADLPDPAEQYDLPVASTDLTNALDDARFHLRALAALVTAEGWGDGEVCRARAALGELASRLGVG